MTGLTAWERWELASFDEKTPAIPGAPSACGRQKLPTADELERIRQTAQEQGYSAGYAAGRAAAQEEADAHRRCRRRSSSMRWPNFDQQVADELLALAIEIARQVVRQRDHGPARDHPRCRPRSPAPTAAPAREPSTCIRTMPPWYAPSLGDSLAHAGHRIHEDPTLEARRLHTGNRRQPARCHGGDTLAPGRRKPRASTRPGTTQEST